MSELAQKAAPARIGKYDVIAVLGRGGMGVVYRARDTRIGRDVAIKTLTEGYSGNPDMLKRFYQEAGHTGNLKHPNIVTVYDFGDEDGLPYIVMEFLDGEPLDKVIRENHTMHLSQKIDAIEQVCEALAYAHTHGMIHRDVKPANIIVQRDGLVKLLDFGIARAGEQVGDVTMTHTGTLVGTPAYMSPERLRGEPFDGRSDIFSTGVVLYQFLTGVLPFPADYPAILQQILHEDPKPLKECLPSCPQQMDTILQRALAKDPAERYGHADEMAAELKAVGKKLKSQRLNELLGEAKNAVQKEEYPQAKILLRQILRMDAEHANAKKLMVSVDQYLSQQKLKQQVDQLTKIAREAVQERNWDQARNACAELLKLDAQNADAVALMAEADAGRQTRERIQQLLREADTARQSGNYDSAIQIAGRASELDPVDSRIQAICKILEQEAEEARRKAQLRKLLQNAQEAITAGHLTDASGAIAEAEKLTSSDADLIRLKDELAEQLRREERKRLVTALQDKSAVAATLDQLNTAMREVTAALEKYPTEPVLLRLKLQLEPRLREQVGRKLVTEVSEACSSLPPAEALVRIREALANLPGNRDLLALESAISLRLTREQREQMLAEYLAKARDLLEDHLYLETVKVLETCETQGFSSPEMTDLLEMARSAAAVRVSQDLVERTFLEAKELLEKQNYEAVLRLLPPVLQRVEEPALRRLLEEATQKQRAIEQRVAQVAAAVKRCCEMEMYDAAIGLISGESPGVRHVQQIRTALETCQKLLDNEAARLQSMGTIYATLSEPECAIAWQRLTSGETSGPSSPAVTDAEQRLGARVRLTVDRHVTQSIDAARQALRSEQPVLANDLLKNTAEWQASAAPAVQEQWKAVLAEIAAAKKVLRFRNVLRR
ncbi:MAG: protein kinase domain-containing protein [Acidobacteriota bacterium]